MLATFIDINLRAGEETVESCKTLVALFRLLQAKEIFVKTYLELMADRLLEWSGVNCDLELEIAGMFKEECGDNFFAKTKQMVADMRLKDEGTLLQKDSKKMKRGQSWHFLILDQSKWPIKTPTQLTIPKQLKDIFEDFIQMYERTKRISKPSAGPSGKNSKNKQLEKAPAAIIMNWIFNQGNCEL